METYIKWLREISKEDVSLVGGKGANLGELTKLGVFVPEGFCITVHAYNDFIKNVEDEIYGLVKSIKINEQSDLRLKAQNIREILLKNEIPGIITKEIREAYMQLAGNLNSPIAVRSSATAEDMPLTSFAGQHETFLNVVGVEPFLHKVKECWASLWTLRAINYRVKHGFDHLKVDMCIVVQKMVFPSVSGVMFTYNSVKSSSDEIVIESTFGLGEGLVAGIVMPDIFIIDKHDLKIKEKNIAEKEMMIIPSRNGTAQTQVSKEKRSVPSLTDEKILELTGIGLKIEQHYKTPQDIEWCFSTDRYYILQSRPVTDIGRRPLALSRKELEGLEGEWTKSPLDERVREPLTPFTWSIAQESIPSFFDALEAFGFHPSKDVELARLFYGRPYLNKTELEKIFQDLPGVVDDFLLGGQIQIDRKKFKFTFSMLPIFFRAILLVNQVHKNWDRELPRIQGEIDTLKGFRIKEASSEELLSQLDHVLSIAHSIATIHALSIIFCEALYQVLVMFVQRYFGVRDDNLCPKLVSGLEENKTLETNKKLWKLAMKAKASEFIRNEILSGNYSQIAKSFGLSREGKEFIAHFQEFLGLYGHRSPKYDLIFPPWVDDPDLVLDLIRTYLTSDMSLDPESIERKGIAEKEKVTELVLESLNTRILDRMFPLKRLVFLKLLKLTQKYMMLRENQQFYIGQGYPIARRITLEIGSHLVEMEVIKDPQDVFFLTIDEVRGMILKREENKGLSMIIIERKKEYELLRKLEPPPLITKHGAKSWPGKEILKGIGASPGMVSGRVRIISDIEEFGQFEEGEILVTPTTNPSWTPLFMMAKGVVTEVGGLLSHGAVVAREYGIPAVLGVKNASKILKNGQKITLDGEKGIIFTNH
jgi:phosphohistidine swiveling domain-containing protein